MLILQKDWPAYNYNLFSLGFIMRRKITIALFAIIIVLITPYLYHNYPSGVRIFKKRICDPIPKEVSGIIGKRCKINLYTGYILKFKAPSDLLAEIVSSKKLQKTESFEFEENKLILPFGTSESPSSIHQSIPSDMNMECNILWFNIKEIEFPEIYHKGGLGLEVLIYDTNSQMAYYVYHSL